MILLHLNYYIANVIIMSLMIRRKNMEIIIITAIVIALISITIIQNIRNKKAIDHYIRHSYGSSERVKDDVLDRIEAVSLLYEHDKKNYSASELVDDITWSDLDMEKIFLKADHTDSFAGEQYIYSALHILGDRDPNSLMNSKTADFFDKNEEKRNSVRKILYEIGKPISAYYTVNTAEDTKSRALPCKYIYPVLLISLLTFAILGIAMKNPLFVILAIMNYLVNMVINIFLRTSYETKLETLFSIGITINAGFSISSIVPELSENVKHSLKSLKKATSILNLLNMRKSMMRSDDNFTMLMSYLTGPFMLDFILYNIGLYELKNKTDDYLCVYRFVGEIDGSIAIASFRKSLSAYCVPEISDEKHLSFTGLFHPLISDPVANDFDSEKNIILTGSNASGKSTFIKSAAINLIMGQTLSTCTAESAKIPRCGVFTSMAVRDDLATGESYYIREIKYLKRMTECVKKGKLLFLAVDEILKGTNTRERIAASKAVMNYFEKENCIIMVATHDAELAEAFDKVYENYYFCEKLDESDIVFDYKIHRGICRSSNAIKLLKVIGFSEDIVSKALEEL